MRPITAVFTNEQAGHITKNMKFFGGKKLDKVRMNIGMETLTYVAQLEQAQNKKISNNPKGLMKSFDLLDSFYGMQVITWKHLLELRKDLYGSDYVKDCCLYAIFRGYCNDLDIVEQIRGLIVDQKKLPDKKRKAIRSKKQ